MKIKIFVFNPFQVNTYLIYDNTGECVIIDASCHEETEISEILEFIESNKLKPKALLNTHGHVDHICGNLFIMKHFNLPLFMNGDDLFLVDTAVEHGQFFGFYIKQPPAPTGLLHEGDIFEFGNSSLKVFHAPGHSPGSLLFYSEKYNFIISGDVLFAGSIGRTDLPGGNFPDLISSIKLKIFTLPGETRVYPGHGNPTTVDREKKTNPFFQ